MHTLRIREFLKTKIVACNIGITVGDRAFVFFLEDYSFAGS